MRIRISTAASAALISLSLLLAGVSEFTPYKMWRLMQIASVLAFAASLWDAGDAVYLHRIQRSNSKDLSDG